MCAGLVAPEYLPVRRARRNVRSDDEYVWNGCQDHIIDGLETAIFSTDAFIVGRPSVDASESAVILKFDPSPSLEALRDRVSSMADLYA